MTDFSYRLCVITHASGGDTLADVLAAFEKHATPAPADIVVVIDGPSFGYVTEALAGRFPDSTVTVWPCPQQEGFCSATRRAWKLASDGPGPLHVVWLEHDHVLLESVDWSEVAAILDDDPTLAQVQLMRGAVNEQEIRHGGLFESRMGAEMWERREWGYVHADYWTTNVSMIRRSFMQENPWVDAAVECEGIFGIGLRERGYRFGVLGDGHPMTEHVGVRSGHSY